MFRKRIIALILAIAMIVSVFPMGIESVFAKEDINVSEMDSLSALGIDSSKPPEGYDPDDKSNPYGKDTVTVNPVKELYQVGLSKNTLNSKYTIPTKGTFTGPILPSRIEGENVDTREAIIKNQTIRGSLFGHNKSAENTASILSSTKVKEIAEGGEWIENTDYDFYSESINPTHLRIGGEWVENPGYDSNEDVENPFFVYRKDEPHYEDGWYKNPHYDAKKASINSPFIRTWGEDWIDNTNYNSNVDSINSPRKFINGKWEDNTEYDAAMPSINSPFTRSGNEWEINANYGPDADSLNSPFIDSGDMKISGKYKNSGGNSYLQSDGYKVEGNLKLNGEDFNITASKVASANFDGNEEGKNAQTVLVYIEEASQNGGLSMRIGDAVTGDYGSKIELIPKKNLIGNPKGQNSIIKEDFVRDPYLMQNYLQVTAGDYDGDGIDEIAVFIPELNGSRIVVYKLKQTTGQTNTSYRDNNQWDIAWTYSLKEFGYVSNMVSLVSGDLNQDGITDLGITWGYYYGPEDNRGSKAVVLFGSKGNMLQKIQEIDLKEGNSEIIRASFTLGDLTGSGRSALVLGGELSEDINEKKTSRYVAVYDWDGVKFAQSNSENFRLFAKDQNGNLVNGAMASNNNTFYSSSLCPANIAVLSQGLPGEKDPIGDQYLGSYIYIDSLLIKYDETGLEIETSLDQHGPNDGNKSYYVEYGGVSGDLVGKGNFTLATMQQTLSRVNAIKTLPSSNYFYTSWWNRFLGIKTWYVGNSPEEVNEFVPGKTFKILINPGENYKHRTEVDTSTSICLANTDNDTVYMQYTGKRFEYSDPDVLAVVSSPPFFKDLLDRGDLSGNYAESTTSYSSTKGEGGAFSFNATIEVGAYISFSQDISVFGVKLGSVEAEASISAGFTFETEHTSMLEQTISYTASSGEDMIAFFSIPLEIYEYRAFVPNDEGIYEEQYMTVNVPHIAAVELIPLDKYENIAKDFDALPQISGKVLKHQVGDPASYSENTNGYRNAVSYNGDWSRVGYTSKDGGDSISQEISMTKEKNNSFNFYTRVEAKAGAGPGGAVVGVTAGAEVGFGVATISTSGNTFTGELQNMPIEAEEFGYGHAWKVFTYLHDDGKMKFSVVDYLVRDVVSPPTLPEDFKQNIDNTTDTEVSLTWSYDRQVAGFQIYRYYEFPDGTGSYELGFVPMTKGVKDENGVFQFEYIDGNLSPYTDYKYQIQTVRPTIPNNSIPSEVITARTKSDTGYPQILLQGLDEDGFLRIYPDSETSISANIENIEDYKGGADFQWQKFDGGKWTDLAAKKSKKLTFKVSGASDQARYRCRANLIYYSKEHGQEYQISAYSDEFETKYSKREATLAPEGLAAITYKKGNSDEMGVDIKLNLMSNNVNHYISPMGEVEFIIKGNNYEARYIRSLKYNSETDEGKATSKAELQLNELVDGVYEVSAYYAGNRVFQSLSIGENAMFLIGESGYQLILEKDEMPSSIYTYGDRIKPTLNSVTSEHGLANPTIETEGVTYFIDNKEVSLEEGTFNTPKIGIYTIEVRKNDNTVASRNFAVEKREISIQAVQEEKIGAGNVSSNLPILKIETGVMAFGGNLEDLKLEIKATNTAGNKIILDNDTDPGHYTIVGGASKDTPVNDYNNYEIIYIPGVYTIVGQTYSVSIEAEKYLQDRDAGTIELLNSEENSEMKFVAGTSLMFQAKPYRGYEVDSWTITTENSTNVGITANMLNSNKTRLSFTTKSESILVKVRFKKSNISLFTMIEGDGSIKCSEPSFTDGASITEDAELEFIAYPSEGYTFSGWKIESGGITSHKEGTPNTDGSNTILHKMGARSTKLIAVFERDKYTINLSENLEATYEYEVGDVEGNTAIKTVNDGAKIVGGTEVLVRAKPGYEVALDVSWTENGEQVTPENGIYKFTIEQDTKILAEAIQQSYTITKTEENGTISVSIDGEDIVDLTKVPGGSKVIFTAHPGHGYTFGSFAVEGTTEFIQEEEILTINELGTDVTVTANYLESDSYSFIVNYGSRASADYILFDVFGKEVERNYVKSGEILTVYKNDTMKLVITPDSGYMIDMWKINSNVDNTRNRNYTFENIHENIDVEVVVISQSSYIVNYSVDGGNGSIISATTDGRLFESGDTDVGGGSKIVIQSNPDDNYMVEKWEIDGDAVLNEDNIFFIGESLIVDKLIPTSTTVNIKVYFREFQEHNVTLDPTDVDIVAEYTPNDANEKEVRDGAKGVFIITPFEGYRIVSAEVVGGDTSEDNVKIIQNKDSVTDDYGTWTVTVSEIKSDVVIRAVAKKIHTITIDSVTGGKLSNTTTTNYSKQAIEGEEVKLSQVAELDYTFDQWNIEDITVNSSMDEGFCFIMPDNNVVIMASFKSIEPIDINYEVYDINGAEEGGYNGTMSAVISRDGVEGYPKNTVDEQISGAIESINRGYTDDYVIWPMSAIKFTASPDDGYKVLKWVVDEIEYDALNSLSLNIEQNSKNMNVSVQFEQIGDSIRYGVVGGNGDILSATNERTTMPFISGNTIATETDIVFQVQPDDGYEVEAWYVNGEPVLEENNNTFTYKADGEHGAVIEVKFARVRFKVNYSSGNGKITSSIENGESVRGDTEITFTAIADPGYKFESYIVEGSGDYITDGHSIVVKITEDTIITAIYSVDENCEIIYNVKGTGGKLEAVKNDISFASGSQGAANDVIIFTAISDANYKVRAWVVDGVEIESETTEFNLTVSEKEHTVNVEFERSNYVVNFSTIGENGSIAAESMTTLMTKDSLKKGSRVSFNAIPNEGYQIKNWNLNGESIVGSSEKLYYEIVYLTEDTTVTVEFEEIPEYDISVTIAGTGKGSLKAYVNESEVLLVGNKLIVKRHDKVRFTAAPIEYNIAEWIVGSSIGEGSDINSSALEDITGDINITVQFKPAELITVKADAVKALEEDEKVNGTISARAGYSNDLENINVVESTVNVIKGKTLEFTADAATEYMVKEWRINGEVLETLENRISLVAERNTNVEVVFEKIKAHKVPVDGTNYTVSNVEKTPDTLPESYSDSVRDRGTVSFTLTPDSGYYFGKLSVLDLDCLTEEKSSEGTTENIITVVSNNDYSYTITIENVLEEIMVDIDSIKPIVTIKETDNGKIEATYIIIDENGDDQLTVLNTGDIIAVGTELTVKAIANSGYRFSKWNESFYKGSRSPVNITVENKNIVIDALFTRVSSDGGGERVPVYYLVAQKTNINNGQITLDKTRGIEGSKINVTVTPEQGYELEVLIASDADGNQLSIIDNKEGTFSFLMPKSNVKVEASFIEKVIEPEEEPEVPHKINYGDVKEGDWFYESIKYVNKNGLMVGTDTNKFSPNEKTNRAMLVTILYRLEENPSVSGNNFADVSSEAWYTNPVSWAADKGIVSGYGDNLFGPTDDMTREQVVAILHNYARYKGYDVSNVASFENFKDSGEISNWAREAMSWGVGSGMISGRSKDTLSPIGTITRAEVASMIERFIENITK